MKNNKKRFELCIKCLREAKVKYKDFHDNNCWNINIEIMKQHISFKKHWTNVALYHPNVDRRICDNCKYKLEHILLQGEK